MAFGEFAHESLARAIRVNVGSVNEIAPCIAKGVVDFLRLFFGRAPSPIFAKGHCAQREFGNAQP